MSRDTIREEVASSRTVTAVRNRFHAAEGFENLYQEITSVAGGIAASEGGPVGPIEKASSSSLLVFCLKSKTYSSSIRPLLKLTSHDKLPESLSEIPGINPARALAARGSDMAFSEYPRAISVMTAPTPDEDRYPNA